jgi:hypothetical protein
MREYIKIHFSKKQLSDACLALILLFLLIFALHGNKLFIYGAIIVCVLSMISTSVIYPWAVLWYSLTEILGNLVSKILLSIIYMLVVWPVGFVRKIIGKDSLQLKDFGHSAASVFRTREKQYESKDLDTPY